MDPTNISCIRWIPKKYCKRDMFYSCYDKNDDDNNLAEQNAQDTQVHDMYMDIPLDNEITNDKLLKDNLIKDDNRDDDEKNLLDDGESSHSCLSVEESDRVLVSGTNYEDCSTLEILLYNIDTCGLETHHEILINGYPLAMELLPRQNLGILACIGSFSPEITIWDIYDIDLIEPLAVLTNISDMSKRKKYQKNGIISLDYGGMYLSAGSEDNCVYLWDLKEQELFETIKHHSDKVQIVKWHNNDPNLLISAAFDKKLAINDIRSDRISCEIKLDSDVECCTWYNDTNSLIIGFEDGNLKCFDLRNMGENNPIWEVKNSKKPCTSISIKSNVLVASSLSGNANIYTLDSNSNICPKPTLLYKKKLGAGPIFTSSVSPDDEYTFSFGGQVVVIANLLSFDEIKHALQ